MRSIIIGFLFSTSLCCAVQAQQNDTIISKKLGEVEVSAMARPSTSQSATPLQILTEKDIQKQGIQSVADALKRFNGVVLKDYGGIGGLKTVSIRGMGAEYTAISYDGMVVNNVQSGQVDIGRFTLDNISMLSLGIGQANDIFLTAKSYTTAGVLNLQTKRPEFTNGKSNVHLKTTTGSFGHFEPMLDYAYKINEKTAITTNVNWQRADGMYRYTQPDDKLIPNRKRRNSDTDILRGEINLYNRLSKSENLDVKLYYFDSERGLPGSVIFYNDADKEERLWNKNAFTQIKYDKVFNAKWKLKSIAKYDYSYEKFRSKVFTHGGEYNWAYDRYKQHEVYWSNTAHYQIISNLAVSASQDLVYNSLRSEFANFNVARSEPNRYSSYSALSAQYMTDRLTLTASALNTYVKETIRNKDTERTFKKLSPAFSASVKPFNSTNLRVRASYKHVYRIPTFSELFYIATGRSLKPESSSQYNVGATWVGAIKDSPFEYINLSVDAYYNDVKDKIIIEPTTHIPRVFNKGKVEMKGIDTKVSTNMKIAEKINLDISGVYNYMSAYNADKTESTYKGQLRYTPKHSGSASLTVNNPWVNISYSVLASDVRYTSEDNSTEYKLESYTEHSITLFKEMDINKYNLYASGSVVNLLDKRYNVIAYYPMPGRSFRVTLGCKF